MPNLGLQARVLSNVRERDVLSFYELTCHTAGECINATFPQLAMMSVTGTHEVTDKALLKTVAAWSVATYTNASNGLMHFGEGSDLWNISFAAAPAAAFANLRATNLVNVDTMSGSGAVIDSCVFSVTACNLGRIKTSDSRVTNTTFSLAVGRNLEIIPLQVWFEGPLKINNVSIMNNTFIGEGRSVVHVSKAATNVTIAGNNFAPPPPPGKQKMLRVVACNATDAFQQWRKVEKSGPAPTPFGLENVGLGLALDSSVGGAEKWETRAPLGFSAFTGAPAQLWSLAAAGNASASRGKLFDSLDKQCLNVVAFTGPDVGLDPCKAAGNVANEIMQMSAVGGGDRAPIQIMNGDKCLAAARVPSL